MSVADVLLLIAINALALGLGGLAGWNLMKWWVGR